MKALIAFVIMLALVYLVAEIAREPVLPKDGIAPTSDEFGSGMNSDFLELVSFDCPQTGQRYSVRLNIRNKSPRNLESVHANVLINPKGRMPFEQQIDFIPGTIQPGRVAEATWSGPENEGRDYQCELVSIRDSSGDLLQQDS